MQGLFTSSLLCGGIIAYPMVMHGGWFGAFGGYIADSEFCFAGNADGNYNGWAGGYLTA